MKSTSRGVPIYRSLMAGVIAAGFAVLAGCGDGNEGGGVAGFATGTFTKSADRGGTDYTGLLDAASAYAHYQYLYLASDIKGAGRVTGLAIKYRNALAAAVTCPNATIKLSHSNLVNLTSAFASNLGTGQGSQTVVLNNTTMTFPAGAAGSWQTVSFAIPFEYNGGDNLIVDVERTSACSGRVEDSVNLAWPYTAGVYTFSSGSATGTLTTWAANGRLVFAGGDNRLTFGGASSNFWPFADTTMVGNTGPRIQNLYLASEIQGSGPITGIAFQTNATSVAGNYTYTLKFGHSSLTTLGANFANNYAGVPMTVAGTTAFSIPAGVPNGEWVWVPIPNGTFTYNGTHNLLVEVTTSTGTANNFLRYSNIAGRRVWADDPSGVAATGSVDGTAYHIALRFHGGAVTVLPAGADAGELYPFGTGTGASSKRQYLYRMSELGSGGRITSVACRLDNAMAGTSLATNYANFQVVLGHTTANTLGTTFATNMTDVTTAFSGTYTLAAGLRAGDWVEIPLNTAFAYDSTKNLVVQLSGDGAANNYNCDIKGDGTRYLDRRASAPDRTAVSGSLLSYQSELKLGISR